MIRHFMVARNGKVIASRSTERHYPYAVVHEGAVGPFATFHQYEWHAERSARSYYGGKGVVTLTTETPRRLPVGYQLEEVVH